MASLRGCFAPAGVPRIAYLIATEITCLRNRRRPSRGSVVDDNSSIRSPRIESAAGPGGSDRRNSQSKIFGGVMTDP
jgi:hypothetical protein